MNKAKMIAAFATATKVAAAALLCLLALPLAAPAADRVVLTDGWQARSSIGLTGDGAAFSAAGYKNDWYRTTVPATALAVLVGNNVYPAPYFGDNLRKVPGGFPPPLDLSSTRKPLNSPFNKPWWYRVDFTVPEGWAGRTVWLHLDGVNYKANLWINGQPAANAADVAGTYRIFDLDVTRFVKPGPNGLAVEVFGPGQTDLALTWVDWNPMPPDREMGLWRGVSLYATGPVAVRHPQVQTELKPGGAAALTVRAFVQNASGGKVEGKLTAKLQGKELTQDVALAPGESREVEFAAFEVAEPKLWWPYQIGEPALHDLVLEFSVAGAVSDRNESKFGIREIKSEMSGPDQDRLIVNVNGRRILVRGGGYASDIMYRPNRARMEAELRYVKQMNLNAIRLEGQLEFDDLYEIGDREGIMIIAGWCCCHHWERWSKWDDEDYRVSEASQRDQILRLRNHPCMIMWMDASDRPPPANVETTYLRVLKELHWPATVTSSANDEPTKVSGPSGVKMTGPYEWVPPSYWYLDDRRGGAFGFNTETSPGPAVPPIETLRAMFPGDALWPIGDAWNYHAGRGQFGNINVYAAAQDGRYGKSKTVEEFALKSQAMTYEGERAMFEAYGRNKYDSTGVIQWMLNNAWPGLIWHLYDWYLRPGGGFFGTQRACEPVHVQYSYDDRSVVVVNGLSRAVPGLKARARVFDVKMKELFNEEKTVDVPADGKIPVLTVPEIAGLSGVYFVRLDLAGEGLEGLPGGAPKPNFYWLSTKMDDLNWLASTWFYTPTSSYADFSGLNRLPAQAVESAVSFKDDGADGVAVVKLTNPGPGLAFMVRMKLAREKGGDEAQGKGEILPVFWSDNYVSLLPGESREIEARWRKADFGGTPALEVSGWNVK